ncbi:Chaperone protein DnaJ [Sulfurospirillum diekertiae]|uniref:Chaperone protein DnaJ n=1 Tax=Sulfurospirillum diekertiae TaxID=1854492 RepID=A0A290HH65_9BACT|nr:J domain-containing protein [Sulfurospirillum diekertiae]ATB70561.1 Chaperone protein DnaJ [Sulfurospirillum diekertiae]
MRLHLSSDCITVNIPESSSHFLHVSKTLSQKFTKSFWVNDTLINFSTPKEEKKRKEFLTSLYYICARTSQTHNLAFLQKLVAMYNKPIKVVKKVVKEMIIHQPYTLDKYYKILEVSQTESLQTIRKKYLHLAKICHPDHQDTSSVEKFQQIQEAYETIKEQKRKKIAA